MKYTNLTNEELVERISAGEEAAYKQLFANLRPVILHEASIYIGKMETHGLEDLIQECEITCWEVISRGNWSKDKGKFSTYFGGAIRNRLIRIFRDYNLKNLVCIGECEDCRGNITRILVESDYAREYRRKKAEQQKRKGIRRSGTNSGWS
jgi:DNA-directed RNA polymerase specialized sigma24 family protein